LSKESKPKVFVLKEGNRNKIYIIEEKRGIEMKHFLGNQEQYTYQHPIKQNDIASCWLLPCPSVRP
jgi:hypothetical protein